ncbi:DeoR/GlpR transcriptional regulator (plasmid) [Phyllobacterium sp. 628]|uniref:DeoR/GlpR family DNA-binding transcription regulator n=1 Tax=Phyllobacterium sp. 628 TaxID=2718938 RepID=UPI0016623891|nr:DeoR/GlpR family DNA-binding transcription regulator [Phyllobacterium sp. 628]QND54653.1 DeoR/GlpR transcriptional regulator [Phyllobacterium sp. 628]
MALPDVRVQVILAELAKNGRVAVKDISKRLDVSRETIRRDLKILEREGHLRCVYGGGVKPVVGLDQPAAERMRINAREKGRLAVLAARLVQNDTKIFIDSGSTTLAFARHLLKIERLNIFTNSLDIAQLFDESYSGSVTVIGGKLNPSYRALFGSSTLEAIKGHLFDVAFVSIAAVDYNFGFMDYGADEAAVRRELRKHSRRCIMLADSNKFGRSANIRTLELQDIDTLVTDAQPRVDFADKLKEAHVEVIYA